MSGKISINLEQFIASKSSQLDLKISHIFHKSIHSGVEQLGVLAGPISYGNAVSLTSHPSLNVEGRLF